MKVRFKVFLPLLLLLTLPVAVQAQFAYTIYNGKVTITGYFGPGVVAIPGTLGGLPVTSIGDGAFQGIYSLTSVTIPSSVSSIGIGAFSTCSSLTSVTISNGLTSIGICAFEHCTSLTSINIPSSVTGIGDGAFQYCSSLPNITIPDSATGIGIYGFYSCSALTNATLGNRVTSIGDHAFAYCYSLASVAIPNSVTSIGDSAFYFCHNLISAAIPTNVTSIGNWAFRLCSSLPSVTIPSRVTTIGAYAFSYCDGLTSINIPSSVTSIGSGPFFGCTHLTEINVDAQNAAYVSLAGVLLNKNRTLLLQYPAGKAGSYTVPSGVTSIGDYAFIWSLDLTSVTIPNSVTNIGSDAFNTCYNLASVFFAGNAPPSVGSYVFDSDSATVYYLPGTRGWNPQVQTSGAGFGVRTNRFGFNIAGSSKMAVVVQACTNLAHPVWSPVGTNTLSGGSSYFSDPRWTNYPGRFYRLSGLTFAGRPAVLWNPQVQTSAASFGVRTNRFGFHITGNTNIPIVVEACTNLTNASWISLQTCTLTNGSLYFSDPQWTNYPARFYRLRSP